MRLSRHSPTLLAALLAALVFGQLISAETSFAQNRSNRDYCLSSGRVRLFLVDVTTEYDSVDKNSIVGMIEKILDSGKGGDLVVIRTISDSYTKSERIIERCLPQCPSSGFVDRLFKCSDGLIKTDTAIVRKDILDALRNRLLKFDETKYSDIIRTLNSVAKEEAREGHEYSLYVYSDLIENSENLIPTRNFFRYQIPVLIDHLQKYGLQAPLTNFEVQVAGVGRAGTPDRRPLTISELNFLTTFWTAYFKAGGAKSISISQNATATP
jgi:hypothetical protein